MRGRLRHSAPCLNMQRGPHATAFLASTRVSKGASPLPRHWPRHCPHRAASLFHRCCQTLGCSRRSRWRRAYPPSSTQSGMSWGLHHGAIQAWLHALHPCRREAHTMDCKAPAKHPLTRTRTHQNTCRVGFKGGADIWTRDVLNVGVCPAALIEALLARFKAAGGGRVLLETLMSCQALPRLRRLPLIPPPPPTLTHTHRPPLCVRPGGGRRRRGL